MKETSPVIDGIVRAALPDLVPTDQLRQCQKPKAILIATGLSKPPMHEQVLPLGLVKIGQLVLVVGPAEFTTMSGRRIRVAVGKDLGIDSRYVVIAAYANDYAGYVTTREEYQSQQYEGGHTLFGPWTEGGYRQEYVRLARSLVTGKPLASEAIPADMRPRVKNASLEGPDERLPDGGKFGDMVGEIKDKYRAGDSVSVTFWTGSPVNAYQRTDRYMAIERLGDDGAWQVVRQDFDWDKTCRWKQVGADGPAKPKTGSPFEGFSLVPASRIPRPDPYQVTIAWHTDDKTAGTFRIVHHGRFKKDGKVERFTAVSPPFRIEGS
jgi:neutral ceramidase